MALNLENKIYIPKNFENTLFERLPFSKEVLSFVRRNKIRFLGELRTVTTDITNQIISSSKKPFPELRRFITQIQNSPSGQVILEKEVESETEYDQENNAKEQQTTGIIYIPENLKQLPVSYLIPSNRLINILKKLEISLLKDLHEISYKRFLQTSGFGKKLISELQGLIKFANRFHSVNDFESILFASIKRKSSEESIEKTIYHEESKTFPQTSEKTGFRKKPNKVGAKRNQTNRIANLTQHKSLKLKIDIPLKFREIPVNRFSFSVRLANILKINNIILLDDLRNFSYKQLKQTPNCGNNTISELQRFISQTQENAELLGKQTDDSLHTLTSQLTLNGLMGFINEFVEQIPVIEKEILLYRLGGSNDEEVLKFEEISKRLQLTKERANQRYTKTIERLLIRLDRSTDILMEKLKEDCLQYVCPLTSQFLIYLTNDNYNLFQYPPAFYIRIIGRLSPEIPILTEYKNKAKKLEEDALKMSKQIKKFLEEHSVPASLTEVFNRVVPFNIAQKDSTKVFFEAVQSVKFNLIKTDNPKEVYIELYEKGKF